MCYITSPICENGGMADTQVLGTCAARRESSSLSSRTRNATNLVLVDKIVLTKSIKFLCGIYKVIHKKIVARHVALKAKCCKVERVCIGLKRLLGHWLVLGTNHQTHTYPLLHIFQQYQHSFFKINVYPPVDSFCNKCNKFINLRHLLPQQIHKCVRNLIRIRTI